MAHISRFAGRYTELVRWWDTSGRSGELRGRIAIAVETDQLRLTMDDGHTMIGEIPGEAIGPIGLIGSGGGATSEGRLYVGEDVMILEYEANVRGRDESNVDVWTIAGDTATRAGLIRQADVTIWFEAQMNKD